MLKSDAGHLSSQLANKKVKLVIAYSEGAIKQLEHVAAKVYQSRHFTVSAPFKGWCLMMLKIERKSSISYRTTLIITFLLTTVFVQAVSSMRQESPPGDELVHISAGYSYLVTRDFRLDPANPPLIRELAAIPLLFMGLTLPTDHPSWDNTRTGYIVDGASMAAFSVQFLFHYNDNYRADEIIFRGRLVIVLLSMLLGAFVFLWARSLYGAKAGVFALLLYTFEPNIIAHSRYVTTDLGLACFMTIALFCFWRFLKEQTRVSALFAGLTCGLALASKLSALVFLIPSYITLFTISICRVKLRVRNVGGNALWFVVILSIGAIVLWGTYFFSLKSIVDLATRDNLAVYLEQNYPVLGRSIVHSIVAIGSQLFLPPQPYLVGLWSVLEHNRIGHMAFLFGQISNRGWWYYFPLAFLIKTPIPLLILILLSFALGRKVRKVNWFDESFLLAPIFLVFIVSMTSHINIGLRYILPVYPLFIILVSKIVNIELNLRFKRVVLVMVAMLSVWYSLKTLQVYPHYLAYFNELVGGPQNGYKYLLDSNLAWHQDLPSLKRYMNEKNVDSIQLFWSGQVDPAYYGINYTPLDTRQPFHGLIAIEASDLPYIDGNKLLAEGHKPINTVGYSILIFDIP